MSGRVILVAEDDPINQRLANKILRHAGYEVLLAGDGAQAVAIARERIPDLILMDLSMPVLSGWDATLELKMDPATHQIPIIACTAHAMAGDKAKSQTYGCDGYVAKPYTPDELLSAVAWGLNLGNAAAAGREPDDT